MADYNSKYTGTQVEALLDIVAQGGSSGGGGGTITEAEIAAMGFTKNEGTITEIKVNGASKGTSGVVELNDIASANDLRTLAEGISEFDKVIGEELAKKQNTISDLEAIRDGAAKGATAVQAEDVLGIVGEVGFVTAEDLAGVATSGSYNDLVDKPTFKTINNESILGSGNITISGGSGGGTITEVKANGTSVATSGVANIPAATTSVYGVTKLTSSTSSTSTTLAATASAVKAAYDLANGKASMSDVNTAIAIAITNVINASY